ncbi:MAG: potassium transporter TrkG, partial [Clostridia bacterium]
TTRTAGFNTIDMSKLAESSVILSVILMVIGGSPGSTAGGLKTTTFAVLVIGVITIIKNRTGIHLFKRRLDDSIMQQACSIATVYILVVVAASMVICAIEGITAREVVFEVASAIGTVGLSMGVTPTLGAISKVLLALIMFTGRIGGLTFGLVIAANREYVPIDRPVEKILIG